jgi:predicted glycoside hydrolase/deacetylase ChbG (UPF0249 family)
LRIRFLFTHDIQPELKETHRYIPDQLREFSPRKPDAFVVNFYDEGATDEGLLNIIYNLPDGTSEIMCHPGYIDNVFARESVYNEQRERELKILTDPSIKEATQSKGINLITFAEI